MKNRNHPSAFTNVSVMAPILIGPVFGALISIGVFWIIKIQGLPRFVVFGVVLGGIAGLCWTKFGAFWRQVNSDAWRVSEIEVDTLGQKWKFSVDSSQRRVAWALFVEICTRMTIQPTKDSDGDDGILLNSLYTLFQLSRKNISEMEPSRSLTSDDQVTDTVETYVLDMLNEDLRPFLAKWHPLWDEWEKTSNSHRCSEWEHHLIFRAELTDVQSRIRARAQGLAKIAGVKNIDRLIYGSVKKGEIWK